MDKLNELNNTVKKLLSSSSTSSIINYINDLLTFMNNNMTTIDKLDDAKNNITGIKSYINNGGNDVYTLHIFYDYLNELKNVIIKSKDINTFKEKYIKYKKKYKLLKSF